MLKDRLKYERQKAGLTQLELSKILNVSQQTVGSWEIGRTAPSSDMLITLANYYKLTLDDFLERTVKYPKDSYIKKTVHESNNKYFSIDHQLTVIIDRIKNSKNDIRFNQKPLSFNQKSQLINDLNTIINKYKTD